MRPKKCQSGTCFENLPLVNNEAALTTRLLSTMLDAFEIFTTSGVVLWSRSSSSIGATAVNNLISNVFIEENVRPAVNASSNPTYKYDKYTLKYTLVKDLGLIFVVCCQICSTWIQAKRLIGSLPVATAPHMGR
jgi:hypothetical protein